MDAETLVVGAGIHSLTFALRYLDENPDLVDEGDRYKFYMRERELCKTFGNWRKCRKRVEIWTRTGYENKTLLEEKKKKLVVVDPSGTWIHNWISNFDAYEIPHLRSPLDVHPSPRDQRDLFAYAMNQRRGKEFTIMGHNHGKNSHGFTGPHQLPSTSLFEDFCKMLIRCFDIEDKVTKGKVAFIHENKNGPRKYKVELDDGSFIFVDNVVVSPGPVMNYAPCFLESGTPYPKERLIPAKALSQWLTSFKENQEPRSQSSKQEEILIIGGGITSGHLATLANRLGYKPSLVLRSSVKVQQFDVSYRWMGKYRSSLIKKFRNKNLQERVNACVAERKSSLSPEVHSRLLDMESKDEIAIFPNTEVSSLYWDYECDHWVVRLDNGQTVNPKYIWTSIGSDVQLDQYPLLDRLMKSHPIDSYLGYPGICEDLRWREDTSIYILGALAISRLGPDGLNMAGARHGSVLAVRSIQKVN